MTTSVLLQFKQIVERHHDNWRDGEEPEENTTHFSQKGILSYSYEPENPKWRRPSPGTAFPEGWIEIHEVYLLETGQIATVERRSSSHCRKTSLVYYESGETVYAEMRIWTLEEITKEKAKIEEELIRMIKVSLAKEET